MGCNKRENTGSCSHFQCPYSTETKHGYECVELLFGTVLGVSVPFCEVGEGCIEKCPYSYNKGDGSKVEQSATAWLKEIEQEFNQ